MNLFTKTALFNGIPFGLCMGIFFSFQYGPTAGIILGIFSGTLFGVAMSYFGKYQALNFAGKIQAFKEKAQAEFQAERPLQEDEKLIKEGGANHFKNIEGVGGWIYLTDKRVFFKSHSVNIQRHELSIPLDSITEVIACMTLWFIPNGILIKTVDGDIERFVVEDRTAWVGEILLAKEHSAFLPEVQL
jgi:hypothetical protein